MKGELFVKGKTAVLLILCMIISLFSMVSPYGNTKVLAEETTEESTFVHPGILHTKESIEAMKKNIADGVEPTISAFNALKSDGFSNATWGGRPLVNVVRGNSGDNRAQMYIDIKRAYQTGLLWTLGQGDAYGDCAVRVLNGWSHTMKTLTGNADRFLASGIYGYQMANAAELVRDHPDFDKEAMEELLLNVFYPMNKDFLTRHNDASIGNYYANWDLANIASMIAIGIFCDRQDIYEEGVSYYKNGEGMGSIYNCMPYVFDSETYGEGYAQWQEMARDHGHTTLGIGLCGAINEMAWSQGKDLYGMSDNRFLKAVEYVVQYNYNGVEAEDLPFSTYVRHNSANNKWETYTGISGAARGRVRPVYTAVYNHYVNRMGLKMPALEKYLYGGESPVVEGVTDRSGDEPGFQSLTFHNISAKETDIKTEPTLKDGIYRFVNNKSRKSMVDNNGTLQSAAKGSMDEEWWEVKNTDDGECIIKNVKTQRVLQLNTTEYTSNSAAHQAGNTFVLADAENGEMNQRFAFMKRKAEYVYRIVVSCSSFVMELANGNTADDATICQYRYTGGSAQEWLVDEKETKGEIAHFSFDDETEGLKGAEAIATANGTLSFVDDATRGKVLFLSNNAWLNVTKEDGTSLLSGNDELTISYYSKVGRTATNWGFYASSDKAAQQSQQEQYIGCFENTGNVTAERYSRTTAGREPKANGKSADGWNHIVVVYAKNQIKLYINGALASTADNTESLNTVLGTDSIFQIGKANWAAGEYYQGLLDDFTVYNYALDEETIQNMDEHRLVAEFTFDNLMDGFATTSAKAVNAGKVVLSDDAASGKALSLDGTGSNYLRVETLDGKPLASGWDEMTVSYWSKVNNNANNWIFYAAPDDEMQIINSEVYLGTAENNGALKVERYKNKYRRIASLSDPVNKNEWKHITISFGKDITKVYINGKKQSELKSAYSVSDILGNDSVFYIGKANWGKKSEFSNALIDNVRIYNFALNDAQAAKDYAGYQAAVDSADDTIDHSAEQAAAQKVVDLINAIGTVEYTDACYKKITNARSAYDKLTDAQKNWVTNADALVNAEKQYKELTPVDKKCLATFTFDDENNGFKSGVAKAESVENVNLSDNAVSGKALRLDGNVSKNYLKLIDADGKSLLNGCKEVTVSYWSKTYNSSANWPFYAAASDDAVVSGREKYLGIYDTGALIKTDRYYNAGSRPASAQAASQICEWRYVTAVFGENSTSLYVNGEKISEVNSEDKISTIIGDDGVTYLGKANWGTGEFYNGLIDEVSIYNYALTADEISTAYQKYTPSEYPKEKKMLADFTFDDEISGFSSTNAKAAATGTNNLSEDAVSGKALNLDGTKNNYLKVTDADGKPLLTDCEELTISYWRKVNNTGTNWAVYAAPNENAQTYQKENYIGIIDKGTSNEVQRWKNNGSRAATGSTEVTQNVWECVTYVFDRHSTQIYVNGELKSEVENAAALPDILSSNSIFYIGRANWNSGEFYNGLIDEMSVYNYALDANAVAKVYEAPAVVNEVKKKITAIGTVDASAECKAKIDAARAAYDALADIQKELVGTDAYNVLTKAEADYEKAVAGEDKPEHTDQCIARFTFDNENDGFKSKQAKASNTGKIELSDDAVSGKALKLDGTGNNYLKITDTDGNSVLSDCEELTVSYWSKVNNNKSNWAYFMAPDDKKQTYQSENYLGLLHKQGNITAERYKNQGARPDSAKAAAEQNTWKQITVVYQKDKTSIYVDGQLQSEEESKYTLSDVLGENSIFYIGKANWNSGEFYDGLIDEVAIYNYALDAENIKALYSIQKEPTEVTNVTNLINAIGTVDASAECKARIDAARAAYDALNDTQKANISAEVLRVLKNAETAYKKAVDEAGESGGGNTETGGNESGGGNTETGGNESGGGNTETGENENSGDNMATGGGTTDTGSGATNTGNSTTTTGTSDTEQAQKEQEQKEQAQAGTTAVEESQKTITSANTDKGDVTGSKFAVLKLKAKEGNKSVKLSWKKVKDADGYIMYGAPCGKKMEQIKELTASKKSYTAKKLKKGKYYKYMVVAYKNIYGEKRVIETSVSVHIATKGGKYGNPTAVTYGKSKISVKTGKIFTLKPGLKTKTKVKTHIAKFRYESTDPSVAIVNKKGKIKGIRKGTCEIYIYAQNGLYKKIKITVK